MAKTESFLYNDSLKDFIKNIKISSEKKKSLVLKVPGMNLKERIRLFKTLTRIYLLDLEEAEAIERIDEFWKKK